jgi:hypothetical protein
VNREPDYRALLAVDIERSGGRGNVAQLQIRERLSRALAASFDQSGIDMSACRRDDLGDGFRVIAAPGMSKSRLLYPLMNELAGRLRTANDTAVPQARVRVRAALHAGDVYLDHDGGVAGLPLEVLARLLDAAPVRQALERAPQTVPVALLISQHFYDETVPHGYPGIDAAAFRKVRVVAKEYAADAWLHLPGSLLPPPDPGPDALPGKDRCAPAPGGPEAGTRSTMINKASGHGVIYASQNGTQHINHRDINHRPET